MAFSFFLADDKWTLAITIGDVKRVKQLLGVDLLQPLPTTKPLSNEFKTWLASGGFDIDALEPKQEVFLRQLFSQEDPQEASLITRLQTDMILLADIVSVLIKPQIDARGLSAEQFDGKIGGEQLNEMIGAFWGAYEDFFLALGNKTMHKMISLQRQLATKAMDAAGEFVDEMQLEKEINALVDQAKVELQEAVDSTRGKTSTSAPDTSESTPTG